MRAIGIAVTFLLSAGGLAASAAGIAGEAKSEKAAPESEGQIQRLIDQLGSEHFVLRERAREELARLGFQAFDALKLAAEQRSREIAHQAAFLVRRIEIPWVRDGDDPEIRDWMSSYAASNDRERREIIEQLAELPEPQQVEPLCRIARYEVSDVLAKSAALELLENRFDQELWQQRAPLIRSALGPSGRTASRWLHTQLLSLRDPQAALERWTEHLAEEQRALAEEPGQTSPSIVAALIRNQVDLLERNGRKDEAIALVDQLLKLEEGSPEALRDMVDWLATRDAWPLVDKVIGRFESQFAADPMLLYGPAESQLKQDRKPAAERLAQMARKLNPDEPNRHWRAAYQLEERGLKKWSESEYRNVIDQAPAAAPASIFARYRLAEMLHDQLRERDAARVFSALVSAMDQDDAVTRTVLQADLDPDAIRSRAEYFWACHWEQQQDFARQKEHLDRGIRHDPTDADILISMYRLKGADPEYRENTRRLIREAADVFRQQIAEDPDDSTAYNQFAWLISNTEGDIDKAIEYSRKSLKLREDQAAYLDTLGRCYYAKGDLENAIKYQSRAVALAPHVDVIRRQLEFFKAEKAKQEKSADEKSGESDD